MSLTRYHVEVLSVLKRNQWQTVDQIYDEIEKRRFEKRHERTSYRFFRLISHELADVVLSPSLAGVYYGLSRLERLGQAEGRPILGKGLMHTRSEWRLSETGTRIMSLEAAMKSGEQTPAYA